MALPMDTLGSMQQHVTATPAPAPLAMPEQSFQTHGLRAHAPARPSVRTLAARATLILVTLSLTAFGVSEMYAVAEVGGVAALEWVLIGAFAVAFGWIAFSSANALAGLFAPRGKNEDIDAPGGLTAIVMPVYNEDPREVFAALAAMVSDLPDQLRTSFEVFVISDTTNPETWIAEERALAILRVQVRADARVVPPPAQQRSPQGRQRGRLRAAVGRALRAHDHARRRQPDDRRVSGAAAGGDDRRSQGRPHSDQPAAHRRADPVRPGPAVRQHRDGTGRRPRRRRLAGRGRQLLGPQRHHPHGRLRRVGRASLAARQASLRRLDPQPRLRRGGAHPPRWLERHDAAGHHRLVRRCADGPLRRHQARPPVGPGQPAARPHHGRGRHGAVLAAALRHWHPRLRDEPGVAVPAAHRCCAVDAGDADLGRSTSPPASPSSRCGRRSMPSGW